MILSLLHATSLAVLITCMWQSVRHGAGPAHGVQQVCLCTVMHCTVYILQQLHLLHVLMVMWLGTSQRGGYAELIMRKWNIFLSFIICWRRNEIELIFPLVKGSVAHKVFPQLRVLLCDLHCGVTFLLLVLQSEALYSIVNRPRA